MGLNITVKNILPIVLKARTLKTECEKYYSSIKIFLPGERLCTREGLNKSTAGVPIFLKGEWPEGCAPSNHSPLPFHFKFLIFNLPQIKGVNSPKWSPHPPFPAFAPPQIPFFPPYFAVGYPRRLAACICLSLTA